MRSLVLRLIIAVSLLALAGTAWAAPVTYSFESGVVQLLGVRSDNQSLVFDETLTISGTQVVWDSAGVPTGFGVGTLDDLVITLPTSGPYSLLQNYGNFDQMSVDSIVISPASGYSTLASIPIGPSVYSVTSGDLEVLAFYSMLDSTGSSAPVSNVQAPTTGSNNLVGTVGLTTDGITLQLNSVVLGTLPGASFGATSDLEITGEITWTGSVAAIPEPTTGVLMALGLGLLAGRRRRSWPLRIGNSKPLFASGKRHDVK
jgi:hypothetical protein